MRVRGRLHCARTGKYTLLMAQKVSGCLRTLTGARQLRAIRSYLSSAARHGTGFFDASSCSPKANPGCLLAPDQTTTISAI